MEQEFIDSHNHNTPHNDKNTPDPLFKDYNRQSITYYQLPRKGTSHRTRKQRKSQNDDEQYEETAQVYWRYKLDVRKRKRTNIVLQPYLILST